jgi:drug/metabolite transporter (DMT)-like permease
MCTQGHQTARQAKLIAAFRPAGQGLSHVYRSCTALAIVLLGERFQLFHAIGYALVFAGITVATRR